MADVALTGVLDGEVKTPGSSDVGILPANVSAPSSGAVIFDHGVKLPDDTSLTLGTGDDATISYDELTDDQLEITCSKGINIWGATGDPTTAAEIYIGTNASGTYDRSIHLQPGNITGWEFTRTGELLGNTGTVRVRPASSGGLDLGSTGAPWGAAYFADDKYLWFGATQDASIGWSNSNTRFEILSDGDLILEGSGGRVEIWVADLIIDSGNDILPANAGGSDLGSGSAQWGNIYVDDNKFIYFGDSNHYAGYVSSLTSLYFRTASVGISGTSADVLIQSGGGGTGATTGDVWIETGGGSGVSTYGSIYLRPGYTTGSGTMMELGNGTIGFYGVTPVAKPTVSGSKGGNAALASLMTALSNLGLVTDSTT